MPVAAHVKTVRGGFLPAAVVLLVAAVALSGPAAYATDAVWKGSPAVGDWNTAANWEGGVVPTSASYDVYIDGAKAGTASEVRLNLTTTIGNLAIDAGDRLTMNNGMDLTITGTQIVNAGTIYADSTSHSFLDLKIAAATCALSGGGVLTLAQATYCTVRGITGDEVLVNVDNTIQGAGQVGYNSVSLENQTAGLVVANLSGGVLKIDPNATAAVNRGTFRATGGGMLLLAEGTFDNAGGTIEALDGSNVELYNAVIQGGLLTTAGSGLFQATLSGTGAAVLDGTASAVTNAGAFEVKHASSTTLKGTIVNSGVLTVKPTGAATTELYVAGGDVTLSGGGSITLVNQTYAVLRGVAGTERLINQDNLIQGTGQVGQNLLRLLNRGTIDANADAALTLDPSAAADGVVNEGLLRASAAGGLTCTSGTFTNSGTIEAAGGNVTFTASVTIANYNAATDALTGGMWKAMADSAVVFNGDPPIATNAADVTLSGAGSVFLPINSLATNAAAGAFHVLGGRTFTTAGALGNAGEVEVGPGSTVTVSGDYVQTSGRTIVDGLLATAGGGVIDILGGDLLGGGTITAEVRLAGIVRPGTSVDTLSAERLLIKSGAAYEFEIDGPTADLVDVLGTGDAFQIDPDPAVPYVVNVTVLNAAGVLGEYVLFHWAGGDPLTQDEFDRLPHVVNLPPGASGHWEYRPDDNQIVVTDFVPEPATLGLLGLGLVAALARRRRARA